MKNDVSEDLKKNKVLVVGNSHVEDLKEENQEKIALLKIK